MTKSWTLAKRHPTAIWHKLDKAMGPVTLDECEPYGPICWPTAAIVAAYIAHNVVPRGSLASLIIDVHASLKHLTAAKPQTPAVPIRQSVTDDYIVCLEDGKRYKSLRPHLTFLGITVDEYRAKWKLPPDYPMVAPSYATVRSELAKKIGLGKTARRVKSAMRGSVA